MARPTFVQAIQKAGGDLATLLAMLISQQQPDGTAFGGTVTALGQTTAANSLPVVLASDQSALPMQQIVATVGVATRIASSATNVANAIPANANRAGMLIHNNSTAILYIKYGSVAVITGGSESYTVQIAVGALWTMPDPTYTGQIDMIWASANGFAMVTETT